MIDAELGQFLIAGMTTVVDGQIFAALAPSTADPRLGTLVFLEQPGRIEDVSGMSATQYQFSVRHADHATAVAIREELIGLLRDYSGKPVTTQFSIYDVIPLGILWEADGEIWHLPVVATIRYMR